MPGNQITAEELALFNSQLAAISRTEVPILPGLLALSRDIRRGRLRRILDTLISETEAGKSLPDALSAVSESLPPAYAAMIQAGIESRNLPGVLESMTQHYQTTQELKEKVCGAMIYPAIVYILSLAILSILAFIITPGFQNVLEEFEMERPATLDVAPMLVFVELGPGALFIIAIASFKFASLTCRGARAAERFRNAIPIYGAVGRNASLARFCSTLGILLDAQVPFPRSLEVCRQAVGSPLISKALEAASESTSQGTALSESLGRTNTFPNTLVWMVSQGEETNTLRETFQDLADFYTSETRRRADFAWNATTPIGVIIVLLTGFPAVTAVASTILSLTQLVNSLGEGGM